MASLPILQAAPELACRTEVVDVPELGGAVNVRGLMASEMFAVSTWREQALSRLLRARAEHARQLRDMPAGATPPEFEAPELNFEELRSYGLYVSQMLAVAVTGANGMGLYSPDGWEICGQHHPRVVDRLQAVVERLSGVDQEDVRKN